MRPDAAVPKRVPVTITLLGPVAVAHGTSRRNGARCLDPGGPGHALGIAAIPSTLHPLVVPSGTLIDVRTVPVIQSAAFLRLPGAAATLLAAVTERLWIGGIGAWSASSLPACRTSQGKPLAPPATSRRMRCRHPGRPVARQPPLLPPAALGVAHRVVITAWPSSFLWMSGGSFPGGHPARTRAPPCGGGEAPGLAATGDPLMSLLNHRGLEMEVAWLLRDSSDLALLALGVDLSGPSTTSVTTPPAMPCCTAWRLSCVMGLSYAQGRSHRGREGGRAPGRRTSPKRGRGCQGTLRQSPRSTLHPAGSPPARDRHEPRRRRDERADQAQGAHDASRRGLPCRQERRARWMALPCGCADGPARP